MPFFSFYSPIISRRYQQSAFPLCLSLVGLLTSCSILHQVSPVNIESVSPELSETVGRVEGRVARTRFYEGLASSILPEKSAETRLALYKEEQRKLELRLIELAYIDVMRNPDYHARTLQELSRFILDKAATSNQHIEFIVSANLKNEFLQYPLSAEKKAAPDESPKPPELIPQASDEEPAVAGAQDATSPAQEPIKQDSPSQNLPVAADDTPIVEVASLPAEPSPIVASPQVLEASALNKPKELPEGLPYGKSLDERGKAGLDVYLKHLIVIVPVLSQQDNEKMLRVYAADLEACKKASIIDTSKDIAVQYQKIGAVVKELDLSSDFVPNTLEVRKQKKELDNIIQFLDDPDKFYRNRPAED